MQTRLDFGSDWCYHFLRPLVFNQRVLYVIANLNICTLSGPKGIWICCHIREKKGGSKVRRTRGHTVAWEDGTTLSHTLLA